MIIIGYPGIGKSTIAKKSKDYIDLESSDFKIDNLRPSEWYMIYGKVAERLSRQGYIVFVSSHDTVRQYLKNNSREEVIAIIPKLELENKWIEKLHERFLDTGWIKDKRAYLAAKANFKNQIMDIKKEDGIKIIEVEDMDYCLEDLIINR